jgi:hypothetical protein
LAVAVGGGGGAIALVVRVIVSPRRTFTIFHYGCSPSLFYLEPHTDGNAATPDSSRHKEANTFIAEI